MRKRNFVCGVALCLALSVAGCGKSSEEQQAVNYYQDELGLDREEAEELAHDIYGEDEEEPSVTEETPEEIVVEPLPELVNSEWYERKLQIYDMVFDNYEDITEEDIRKTVEGSSYDVELEEGFDENGEICIKSLMLDGKRLAQIWKRNWTSDDDLVKYGLRNEGYSYWIGYGPAYEESIWYDKASVEFKDFQTRDDVLAYLTENGFVEVEKEQATYAGFKTLYGMGKVYPDERPVEYADVPHYYCNGVQSITLFRSHKLGETDHVFEVVAYPTHYYSGAHLNVVNYATFEFDTDGTIVSREFSQFAHYNDAADLSEAPGLYIPGLYDQSSFTREFMIMGEEIDEQ